ncbi:hypothetical protein NP493_183g03037 [Ridgeia piscesae]|uniref:Uncharacterized protein n=1 Tax=Ridgeia piscesae TaxID=27915 RepID=A0AAD9P2I8_RIDPI|nr:hypothetical protein NP493_183g03037 [Ridgeia piscesae]
MFDHDSRVERAIAPSKSVKCKWCKCWCSGNCSCWCTTYGCMCNSKFKYSSGRCFAHTRFLFWTYECIGKRRGFTCRCFNKKRVKCTSPRQ